MRSTMLVFLFFAFGQWASMCQTAPPPETEFSARYYDNHTLSGEPVLVRYEDTINHQWGQGSPGDEIPVNFFSASWTGNIHFEAGTWIFHLRGDDGVRLRIDGEDVIDGWRYQAATSYLAEVRLSEGEHLIEVTYFEATGLASIELDWSKSEEEPLPQDSFRASFYNSMIPAGEPVLITETDRINYNWGDAGPLDILSDHFSARWEGDFYFESGRYTFTAIADDGIQLLIDGERVIDGWLDQAGTAFSEKRFIEEGRHHVEVIYFESEGSARIDLSWALDNLTRESSPMGTNISSLDYYSTELTLRDAMKSAGGWYTRNESTWDTGEQELLRLDENGWVRALPKDRLPMGITNPTRFRQVAALMLNGTAGRYPAGTYVVTYEGTGTLSYGFDAVKNEELSQPGRHVLQVAEPSNAGILLVISETDPTGTGDYLRNIRVTLPMPEGSPDEGLFHPTFLAELQPYKVLRFMDFLRTNTTTLTSWQQRPRLEDARWNTEQGAPIEIALALANQTQSDAWFNMPHLADDDYVEQFAQLALELLGPERRVYVEYGNEIWNTAFSAGNWVQQQAEALWPESEADPYTKRMNWYGKRSVEMIAIWKRVWGEQANRIIGVVGGFSANSWVTEQSLQVPLWIREEGDPPVELVDAVAIAPYFGGYLGFSQFEADLSSWTSAEKGLDLLFQELLEGGPLYNEEVEPAWLRAPLTGALARSAEGMAAHGQIAERFGIEMIAYEGGQHLVGVGPTQWNQEITDFLIAANRDQRMYDAYSRYLDLWKENGGNLFCHFLSVGQYSAYGSWGVREYQGQETTPKLEAILDFIALNPCWWEGCSEEEPSEEPVSDGTP